MNRKKGRSSALFHFDVNGFQSAPRLPGTKQPKPLADCACPLTVLRTHAKDLAQLLMFQTPQSR